MTAPVTHYVPDCAVTLGGRPIGAELRTRITGIRFEESMEGANRVEIELADPDLRLGDHAELDLDVPLGLALGYQPGLMEPMFTGTVTGVEPSFPASGMPAVTVSAHDATRRLASGTKRRGFPWYLTDSVIATIVAAEHQLIAVPDVAASLVTGLGLFAERPRIQNAQSDYDFLRRIAAEYGFDMWVDGNQLNFKLALPGLPAPEIELRWGASLLDFTPRLSGVGQVARVSARVWVEALKTQLSVEIGWDGERIQARVGPTAFAGGSDPVEATLSLPDMPSDSAVEAITFAVGELRRRLNTRITARGSTEGDPRLRVGRLISVYGVGARFSSSAYRLTSVVHTFDGNGYRTGFEARREVI